ncbi:hypothetical protein J6590_075615, partial [Homalodisca vitripennis]
ATNAYLVVVLDISQLDGSSCALQLSQETSAFYQCLSRSEGQSVAVRFWDYRCHDRGRIDPRQTETTNDQRINVLKCRPLVSRHNLWRSAGFYFLQSICQPTIALTLFFFFDIKGLTTTAIIVDGAWIINHVVHLILVTDQSTLVERLADETTPIICKWINLDLDPSLVEFLEGVLEHLRKQSKIFCAWGFPIHNSALTGMVRTVTTYQ